PAHQCLSAGHRPGPQIDIWHVDEAEFAVFERRTELPAVGEMPACRQLHRWIKYPNLTLACSFGLVHGDVGVAQQTARREPRCGNGNTDTGHHRDLVAARWNRCLEFLE